MQNMSYKGFFVFVSMMIPAEMALFLQGVCSARFFADLLRDDSFGTCYKNMDVLKLWVFAV